jgi:hypothetical protein
MLIAIILGLSPIFHKFEPPEFVSHGRRHLTPDIAI